MLWNRFTQVSNANRSSFIYLFFGKNENLELNKEWKLVEGDRDRNGTNIELFCFPDKPKPEVQNKNKTKE